MEAVAEEDAEEDVLPDADVARGAEEDGLAVGEEEEVGGQLVVDGLVERGVGRWCGEWGEALQEGDRVEEAEVGSAERGEGFEVEEGEGVGPGDVDGWGHDDDDGISP